MNSALLLHFLSSIDLQYTANHLNIKKNFDHIFQKGKKKSQKIHKTALRHFFLIHLEVELSFFPSSSVLVQTLTN